MFQEIELFLESWFLPSLVVGIIMLLWGGNLLVDGAIIFARRFGLSPLLIGLTIVAFGTSAPELAFNIVAALDDASALSFGNIIGSNIANVGLVIGICAIIVPLEIHARVIKRELPLVGLVSVGALVLAWFPPHRIVAGEPLPAFSRFDGGLLGAGFLCFMFTMYQMSRSDRETARLIEAEAGFDEETIEKLEQGSVKPDRSQSLGRALVLFVAGLAFLVSGGNAAEAGAVGLATWLELGEEIIALTVVAIATSLPEVATSIVAARKGHADLAVGNVVGSNIFNLLLVMCVTALISPVELPNGGFEDLIAMIAIASVFAVLALSVRRRVPRAGGILLLGLYCAYLTYRVLRERGMLP